MKSEKLELKIVNRAVGPDDDSDYDISIDARCEGYGEDTDKENRQLDIIETLLLSLRIVLSEANCSATTFAELLADTIDLDFDAVSENVIEEDDALDSETEYLMRLFYRKDGKAN